MPAPRTLMIVDVQRAFDPPPAYVKKLARYAKRFPCCIHTRFINPPSSLFHRVLKRKSCPPGAEECQLILTPKKGDLVMDKVGRYGLSDRQVAQLKRRKIKKIVVCGLDTDACVLGVMFSLFDAGIECHLKPSMCWSSSGLHKEALAVAAEQFKPLR